MKTLTLEQVQSAGILAVGFTDDDPADVLILRPKKGRERHDRLIWMDSRDRRPRTAQSWRGRVAWHHLPGCDCEFCR